MSHDCCLSVGVSAALSKLSAVLSQSSQQLRPCLEEVALATPGLQPLQLQVESKWRDVLPWQYWFGYLRVMVMFVAIVIGWE